MRICYIAGPYRAATIHEIKLNIDRAEKYARKYWQLGYAVICPHKNSGLFDGICDDRQFLEGDHEFIRRMTTDDLMVMIPGYENSSGSIAELELADDLGIPVKFEDFI